MVLHNDPGYNAIVAGISGVEDTYMVLYYYNVPATATGVTYGKSYQ